MKRVGHLFPSIIAWDNLNLSFYKAAAGKRSRPAVLRFERNLDSHLANLQSGLQNGTFPIGAYERFTIFDPKKRVIHAAAFPERVLHHALMTICDPVFERLAIFDSYACRRNKGSLAAVQRASFFAKNYRWFLKMDIFHYFDSIDHFFLLELLRRKFKEPLLLYWFEKIIASFQQEPRKGLPIGSLTSQYFANLYLALLDRYVKETLGCHAYVRYMDDFVVWADDAQTLRDVLQRIIVFLDTVLQLSLKDAIQLNQTGKGMTFLGYRVYPGVLRLSHSSRNRFRRKIKILERLYQFDKITELELQKRACSLLSFTKHADCQAWRSRIFHGEGPQIARIASFGAAVSGTMPGTCGAPIATGTNRVTATGTMASAWPQAHLYGLDSPKLNQDPLPPVTPITANQVLPSGCE